MRPPQFCAAALAVMLLLLVGGSAFAAGGPLTVWNQDFATDDAGWIDDETLAGYGHITASGGTATVEGFADSCPNYVQSRGIATCYYGPFSRFDGYRSVWPGTWTAEIDVYLDPDWSAGQGFDYSVAANGSDGNHQRDYIFHVGVVENYGPFTGKALLVNGSNNSDSYTNPYKLVNDNSGNYYEVTTPGWYTLQHVFYDAGGYLAVDLNLLDTVGNVLWTATRSSTADTIPGEVGGNRYGWFTHVTGVALEVDNHQLILSDAPTLDIERAVVPMHNNQTFGVPVYLHPGDQNLASVGFTVAWDNACVSLDATTDSNNDGIPDAIAGVPPAGFSASIERNALQEVTILIKPLDDSGTLPTLVDGTLATLTLDAQACVTTDGTTVSVNFTFPTTASPAVPSFGDDQGQSVPGTADGGVVTLVFNASPTDILLAPTTVDENLQAGANVGTLCTEDPDGTDCSGGSATFTYSLACTGAGNFAFQIVGNALQTAGVLDYETQPAGGYEVCVRSEDADGLAIDKVFAVEVNNVNEAPTDIQLDDGTPEDGKYLVPENAPVPSLVGTLSTVDEDQPDSHSYAFCPVTFDGNPVSFRVKGDPNNKDVYLGIGDLGVPANRVDAESGRLPDGLNPFTFAFDPGTNKLTGTIPDAGVNLEWDLSSGLQACPSGGWNALKISVADRKDNSGVALKNLTLDGIVLGDFGAVDVAGIPGWQDWTVRSDAFSDGFVLAGALDVVNFTENERVKVELQVGCDPTAANKFAIANDVLQTSVPLDFEEQSTYNVCIRSTDEGGLFVERTFTISAEDQNDAPVAVDDPAVPPLIVVGDNVPTVIDVLANDTDQDGDDLSVDSVQASTGAGAGTVTNNGTDVSYTAALNFNGEDTFAYVAKDTGGLTSNEATVSVNVVANDARGDCNADGQIDAADFPATVLEIFDKADPIEWWKIYLGDFAGSPRGCDSNASENGLNPAAPQASVTAPDIVCTVLAFFGNNSCTSGVTAIAAVTEPASFLIPSGVEGTAGTNVTVPVKLETAGSAVAAATFALKYDPAAASFDATDSDGDGVPDAISINAPAGMAKMVRVDAKAGLIQVAVYSTALPMPLLNDSVLATITLRMEAAASSLELVQGSLGSDEGQSIPVAIDVTTAPLSGANGGSLFLPLLQSK